MKFTVRVELHGVKHDSEKYTELHKEMKNQGFSRTIGIDGIRYELPTAEYNCVSEESKDQILNRAKGAAKKIMGSDSNYSILVTAAETPRVQHNLARSE